MTEQTPEIFQTLPTGPYDIILADPPWPIRKSRGKTRHGSSPEDHYNVLSFKDLETLKVGSVAADNSHLCLWVVQCFMDRCINIGESWGFKYSTILFTWDKQRTMMGYYTHPQHELCLLFRRGQPTKIERGSVTERQLITEKRTAHSKKTTQAHERIERLWPTARRLELFARTPRDGWTTWGNEL